ncbi:MAG: hypothetical protein F4139_09815 [Gemmatimonadetes bacterium]|nr:hypothetical protein [Gemmatimonadota bacterium]MYA65204.1 hypothetical protein [Gemmatimonadota bacterium]MYB99810.1 hypothetical protein [Gemmatimonadota bacterium]MYH53230.1 hypothetical protein [Gemmatimonadota bacterium]MYI45848.1 hypothetical protein [Gemmatimonadota bacterium]
MSTPDTAGKRRGSFGFAGTLASASFGVAAMAAVAGFTPDAATSHPPVSNPHLRESQDTVSFAEQILPIFQNRCAKCHGAEDENGEVRTEVSLSLLEYERVMVGSEFGTVIEAGDPDGSFLVDMITAGDMPPEGEGDNVPEEEIALIRTWIEQGALNN